MPGYIVMHVLLKSQVDGNLLSFSLLDKLLTSMTISYLVYTGTGNKQISEKNTPKASYTYWVCLFKISA